VSLSKYVSLVTSFKGINISCARFEVSAMRSRGFGLVFDDVSKKEGTTFIQNVREDPLTHRHIPGELNP
jgi:hypothetical protein